MKKRTPSLTCDHSDQKEVRGLGTKITPDPTLVFAQRYQAFFESTTDAIAVFNGEGEILDANPQLLKLSGYSYETIVSKSLKDLFRKSSYEEIWARFRVLLEGRKRKYPVECELVSESGKRRLIEVSLSLLRNQYGYSKTILAMIRDVTRRKVAEKRVVQRAEELQKVFDTVQTILLVVDERKCIRRINRSGLEALLKDESEVLGKRVGDVLGCVNRLDSSGECGMGSHCRNCVIGGSIFDCLNGGEPVLGVEEAITRENFEESPFYFRINVVPLKTRGKSWGVVSLDDITDRKRAELEFYRLNNSITRANLELKKTLEDLTRSQYQLLESQKLEQIGLLASGLAHNLRTPLGGIKGYAQLLKMDQGEFQELNMIISEVEVMESIINNLMLKNRKDNENKELILNLNNLLEIELEFLSANMFFKHRVQKEIFLDKNLPPVSGVYAHFSQVISNIIQNALDAMYDTQERKLIIRTRHDDQFIYIEITDTGCGIPDDICDTVFDVFYTTKPTTEEREGDEPFGTGLGLSSANYFIRQYGGKIGISSKIGEGTKVTIKVPHKQKEKASPVQRVLIVDDSDAMVNILTQVCEDMGIEAYGVMDGEKALDIYKKMKPHVIISDLCMPGLTGTEMMSKIRSLNPSQRVIYVSGYLENPEFEKWLEQETEQPSLCAVLKKPFSLESFRETLKRMVFD